MYTMATGLVWIWRVITSDGPANGKQESRVQQSELLNIVQVSHLTMPALSDKPHNVSLIFT